MKLYIQLGAFLALFFFPHFTLFASDEAENQFIEAIFASWAMGQGFEGEELLALTQSLKENCSVEQLVNQMVECGASSLEVQRVLSQAGVEIPNTAKLDNGLHAIILGRMSLLGSFKSNVNSILKNGACTWFLKNSLCILGYISTLQILLPATSAYSMYEVSNESCFGFNESNTALVPYSPKELALPTINHCYGLQPGEQIWIQSIDENLFNVPSNFTHICENQCPLERPAHYLEKDTMLAGPF
jgi:hypothetical protein